MAHEREADMYSVAEDGTKTDAWIMDELLGDDDLPDDEYTHVIGGEARTDLGGQGSGNFGHSGRPGEIGGSGPGGGGVPVEPGTTPIPEGKIRGYHYTDDLDAVLAHGLDVSKAKGSTYGEPNAIWFSTEKPKDFKHYVEVHLDPEEVGLNGPLWSREDPTTPEALRKIDEYNKGNHDFMARVQTVPPDRFVTTHLPWHDKYRYITRPDNERLREEILAGDHDALTADDEEYGPAIRLFKEQHAKKAKEQP